MFLHLLNSGLEGIEPSTRSFGDFRSTTELQPYIICPNNKPDSVLSIMYLYRLIVNVLHFFIEMNKLASGMVYHSNPYRGDWVEVVYRSTHPRVASFIRKRISLRFCGTFIYPFGFQYLLDITCFMMSGLSSLYFYRAIQNLDLLNLVNRFHNSTVIFYFIFSTCFFILSLLYVR